MDILKLIESIAYLAMATSSLGLFLTYKVWRIMMENERIMAAWKAFRI